MHVTIRSDQTVEIRNTGGKLCGTYHYEDPFKSFFRGLFTPNGKDVVAYPGESLAARYVITVSDV